MKFLLLYNQSASGGSKYLCPLQSSPEKPELNRKRSGYMKTYEYYSYWEEFDVISTLVLNDDGRFSCSDNYSSYGGGFGGEAQGVWRQSGDTIFLRAEHLEGATRRQWAVGQEQQAVERGDSLDFGQGFTMSLRHEKPPVQDAQQPKGEEAVQPDDAEKQKKQLPTVAKLHFKDGSVQERQLTDVPFFSLFEEMFYQLVDENGNVTNIFKARQNFKNVDSSIAEYDEIDSTPSVRTDDF
jgi:hypothetical protein